VPYDGGNVFALYKSGGKWVSSTIWAFGGTPGDGTQPECDLVIDKSATCMGRPIPAAPIMWARVRIEQRQRGVERGP